MFAKIVIIVVITTIAQVSTDTETRKITASFQKIGQLATGLSYGHLHAVFPFKKWKTTVLEFEQFLSEEHQRGLANKPELHEKSRTILKLFRQQHQQSLKEVNQLEHIFFNEKPNIRSKRQLGPISLGFGIFGLGLSIYNTIEIRQIHNKLSKLQDGMNIIGHTIQEQHETITALTHSVSSLKMVCHRLLVSIDKEHKENVVLFTLIAISSLLENHNSNVSAVARGLTSLLHGKINPEIINPSHIADAWEQLKLKALKHNVKPLFNEISSIYKMDISYLTTEDEDIAIFIHVPMIENKPMALYEYFPVPIQIGNLLVTIGAEQELIATDDIGNKGKLISKGDIQKCQTVRIHSGNMFVCPHMNLLQNNIRSSCLGSLLFKKDFMKTCQQNVISMEKAQHFAKQIGSNKLIIFGNENRVVMEICPHNKTQINVKGLTRITVKDTCRIESEDFTFVPEMDIDIDVDFLENIHETSLIDFTDNNKIEDLEKAYKELESIIVPKPRPLTELSKWLKDSERDTSKSVITLLIAICSITVCFGIIVYLICVYLNYRSKNKTTKSVQAETGGL